MPSTDASTEPRSTSDAGRSQMLPSAQLGPRRSPLRNARRMRTGRLLLLPALALAALSASACAEDVGPTVPNLPPIPSALPSGLPTALPTAVPTAAPTAAPASQGSATPIGFDGALLQPSSLPVESSAGESASCDDVVDNGWTVDDCGAVANYAWVVSRHGALGEPGTGWQAYVAYFDSDKGSWVKVLSYTDVAGDDVTAISGRSAALSGAGEDVVFGYRHQGTGQILSYDIVGTDSDPTILAHRDLAHGEATLDGPTILDSQAEYPNDEPNCCPAYFQQSRVSWRDSDGQFVVTPVARDDDQPQGDF